MQGGPHRYVRSHFVGIVFEVLRVASHRGRNNLEPLLWLCFTTLYYTPTPSFPLILWCLTNARPTPSALNTLPGVCRLEGWIPSPGP